MTPAETAIREALAAGPTPGPLVAWITEAGCECLQRGEGPVRVMPEENDETGFTVPLYAPTRLIAACNPAALAELLAELDRLRTCLKRANDQAEHFEREWYLRGDELDGERNRSQMYADLVRGVAVVLHGEGWSDTSKLPEEVAKLKAERDVAKDALSAEMDENWRLRETGGALLSENMTEFVERLIAENKALREANDSLASAAILPDHQMIVDRAEVEARIEEAFKEGFISVQTYNDTRLNSPDEAWEENKRSLLRGIAIDAAKGGGNG